MMVYRDPGLNRAWLRQWNLPTAFRRNRLAHIPLADAIAAAPLDQIKMNMTFVTGVGARPEHGGEAVAGAVAQLLAEILRNRDVGQSKQPPVGQDEGAHIERV